MVKMEAYYLKPQLPGAEACRNGHSAVSALVGQVREWLKAGKVAAVPERIRHAFLQVRHYAKQNGGSLQIDFIQTIKPLSVVLFFASSSSTDSTLHPSPHIFFLLLGICNIISGLFMSEVRSEPST
jgi:hypothetical protein